jgi:hypothetical protein
MVCGVVVFFVIVAGVIANMPTNLLHYFFTNWTFHISIVTHFMYLAGEKGLEPLLPGPKPGVLPLDDSPVLVTDRF